MRLPAVASAVLDDRVGSREDESLVFVIRPLDDVGRLALLPPDLDDPTYSLRLPDAIALDDQTISDLGVHVISSRYELATMVTRSLEACLGCGS